MNLRASAAPDVVSLLLAATALRAPLLAQNRFHPDEALYASFGRLIASGQDPGLAGVLVDKPPLGFYLYAGSLALFGPSEFSARLPSFAASLLSIALLWRLALCLYRSPTAAATAAGLLTLSPFAVLFSASLFFDTLLAVFMLWALLASARNRPTWAGLAFGLGFLIKQSALQFFPLVVSFLLLARSVAPVGRRAPAGGQRILPALAPLILIPAACALLAFGWDAARHAQVGFWAQGYADNVPNRLIRSAEVIPRLRAWGQLLSYFAPSPFVVVPIVVGLILALVRALSRPTASGHTFDLLVLSFGIASLGAYWLLAFNVWDRYLVPLVPLASLLGGRGIAALAQRLERVSSRPLVRWLLPIGLGLLLMPSSIHASQSKYPIGGDHGAYDGIDGMASHIRTLPAGSVLYDHWLSWEWRFYLFDSPVYIAWMPSPGALADDLQAFGRDGTARFIVVPGWESPSEVQAAAARAGFAMNPIYATHDRLGNVSFTLYEFQGHDE